MSLRIGIESANTKTSISIAGDLSAEGVPSLEQALRTNGGCCELDLSYLRFADSAGVEALRRLIDTGATVSGESPFIKMLLVK